MFDSAYIRLTSWYVVIIMAISLLFSAWVYNTADLELREGLEAQAVRMGNSVIVHNGVPVASARQIIDEQLITSRRRLVMNLILFNTGVLMAGAVASYFLAKRTLRPIKESIEAQNRFTADASHELRTPLAAMKTEIEVALRDNKLTTAESRELLQSNLEEIDRMSGLAEGLLALAQAEQAAPAHPVQLEPVAKKVIKRLKPLAQAKGIALTPELHPVTVRAHAESVDKILGILLDNAIKYSPADTAITLRSTQENGVGKLLVSDQGVGIKASDIPHIFDRFYRADTARSKVYASGYGLGLAIAHKLATAYDGKISVDSTVGKGSTFTVTFPLA